MTDTLNERIEKFDAYHHHELCDIYDPRPAEEAKPCNCWKSLLTACQKRIQETDEKLRITEYSENEFRKLCEEKGEMIQKLEAELATARHAENMLRHDLGEANRIHNAEMNRMSAELQAAKDAVVGVGLAVTAPRRC